MRILIKIIIWIALIFVFYTLTRIVSNRAEIDSMTVQEPVVAVFYPDTSGGDFVFDQVPHFRLKWGRSPLAMPDTDWLDTISLDKPVLLTLEFWETHVWHRNGPSAVQDIIQGKVDDRIIKFCKTVLAEHPNVMLRPDPEMEVPSGRYPWENRPHEYIRAFLHIDSLLDIHAPSAKLVWGPAGYPGAEEFWPGNESVDFTSITLGSASERKVNAYPPYKSLTEELKRKLHRLRYFDVPVIVISREKNKPADVFDAVLNERRAHTDVYNLSAAKSDSYSGGLDRIGVYDPDSLLVGDGAVNTEHLFADFENIASGIFSKRLKQAESRGHDVIVTMEPMFPSHEERDRDVLNKVLEGSYDVDFSSFFQLLAAFNGQVYLRFAHEMEIPIERYPWQSQDPLLYIRTYQYFMDFAAREVPGVKRIWGPAGDRGSLEWYPGDAFVDYISIAIYGLPDKNISDPEKQESFETIYNRKIRRMRLEDKPVFITEFGVKGPEDYQRHWMLNAAGVINEHPEIYGICYFNMIDNPDVWGEGMDAPDWSLTQETWDRFNAELKTQGN